MPAPGAPPLPADGRAPATPHPALRSGHSAQQRAADLQHVGTASMHAHNVMKTFALRTAASLVFLHDYHVRSWYIMYDVHLFTQQRTHVYAYMHMHVLYACVMCMCIPEARELPRFALAHWRAPSNPLLTRVPIQFPGCGRSVGGPCLPSGPQTRLSTLPTPPSNRPFAPQVLNPEAISALEEGEAALAAQPHPHPSPHPTLTPQTPQHPTTLQHISRC